MGCALSHDFSLIFLWLCWAIKTEILFQKGFHPIVYRSMHVLLNVSDKKKVAKNPQHIYWDSKILASVVYFADPV